MTAQKDNPKLTITLTDRKPIIIIKDNWPVVASSEDKEFDNEYEFQANRTSNWRLTVRQHSDGRTIVYGVYTYSSNYQNDKSVQIRGGEMLDVGADAIPVIRRVGNWMQERTPGDDAGRWENLINECIGDLPADELD